MPPQMPPDQAKQIYRNINTKPETATLVDGVLTIETEFGYVVKFKMQPYFGINTTRPWMQNQRKELIPEFQTAFNMAPLDVGPVADKAKSRDDILEALKTKNVLPKLDMDNFTVGFVYAQADNPQNHKWMLEFRKNKNIFHAMHFLGVDIDCPFGTTSWHDGIYHGRFQINAEAYKSVLEMGKPGWVTITGNKNKHRSKGDVGMIPTGCERVRFRFNVKTDYWYGDFLGKGDDTVAPSLKMHDILGEGLKLTGHIDWDSNPAKPRVMFHVKANDIKDISMMAETLVIKG